jgi:hypothetical protein
MASWLETQKENEQKRLKNLPEMMRRKTADEIERSDTEKAKGLRDFFSSTGGSRGRGANPTTNSTTKPSVKSEVKPSVKVDSKPSVKMSTSPSISKGMPLSDEIDSLVGSSKGSDTAPDAVIKKTEIVKTAPVVSRKSAPSTMKPKESDTSRPKSKYRNGYSEADIDAMIAKADNGKTAAFKEATDAYLAKQNPDAATAEDMNMQNKPDTPSVPMAEDTVGGNAMKKGGMTKRPPKPAKKVPPRKFASGGSTSRSSASSRGDGCATKGHTKGKYL